jgi:hypothetical protein
MAGQDHFSFLLRFISKKFQFHTDEVHELLLFVIKMLKMLNKIASVEILVPYKGPGNIIKQNPVLFDVYFGDEHYKAVPLLNEHERRIANLPHELFFVYENGKPVSQRGSFDGNFHAIEDIVRELQKQKLI